MANLRWIFGALLILALVLGGSVAQAITNGDSDYTITATVTADNNFILYYGTSDGTVDGTVIERVGSGPSSGNWRTPVTFSNFTVPTGDYLYVLAWNDLNKNDTTNPNAWLGQFIASGYQPLYSNLSDWQYIYTTSGNPSSPGNPALIDVDVQGLIRTATQSGVWATATLKLENISNPDAHFIGNYSPNQEPPRLEGNGDNFWNDTTGGPISGISPVANWIWHDFFGEAFQGPRSASTYGYAIFRADLSGLTPVPLPASVLLLGSGLAGLGLLGYRRKNS